LLKLQSSWLEQRRWGFDIPLEALKHTTSSGAKYLLEQITHELNVAMKPVTHEPEREGYTRMGDLSRVAVGNYRVDIDASSGAITSITSLSSSSEAHADWASTTKPLALLRYQTLVEEDFAKMREEYFPFGAGTAAKE
jgi:hypothetical protein